jgi:hypothetical protein
MTFLVGVLKSASSIKMRIADVRHFWISKNSKSLIQQGF